MEMDDIQDEPIPLTGGGRHSNTTNDLDAEQQQQQQQQHDMNNDLHHSLLNNGDGSDSEDSKDPNRFNAYLNRGSELWTHWTWLGGQGKMSLMRCNYCLVNKQLKNAPKCRRHLIKCQKTPELVRKYFERKELEASRVSAFMREIRSKEVKFPRGSTTTESASKNLVAQVVNSQVEAAAAENGAVGKVPLPTANDLKHLHQKQHAATSIIHKTPSNGATTNGGTSSTVAKQAKHHHQQHRESTPPTSKDLSNNNIDHHHPQKMNYSASMISGGGKTSSSSSTPGANHNVDHQKVLYNYSPMINRNKTGGSNNSSILEFHQTTTSSNKKKQHHQNQQLLDSSSLLNDVNYNLLCHLMSITGAATSGTGGNGSGGAFSSDSLLLDPHLVAGQQASPPPPLMVTPGSHNKLKRKHHHHHSISNGSSGSSIINKENNGATDLSNTGKINANNTVVINLDEIPYLPDAASMDSSPTSAALAYFNSLENGGHLSGNAAGTPSVNPLLNGGGAASLVVPPLRKKKRDNGYHGNSMMVMNASTKLPPASGYRNGAGGMDTSTPKNGYSNANNNEFGTFDQHDIEIVHDDLNDLLLSALISQGVPLDLVQNCYFQKFVTQLVNFVSSSRQNGHHHHHHHGKNHQYRLPTVDKLTSINVNNLIRKFDYETAKVFSECDSIIVSFDTSTTSLPAIGAASTAATNVPAAQQPPHQSSPISMTTAAMAATGNDRRLNVNLLISTSNTCLNLFYKTISCGSGKSPSGENSIDVKMLNNRIDSLLNKIGPDRINAVILPYGDARSSELIYSYLAACHSHIVPLTNSYRLFNHLLCDICRIPAIFKIIAQCMTLFQELQTNLPDDCWFHRENKNHWKQVLESDNLKIFKYFLNNTGDEDSSSSSPGPPKNAYWISLNLMLCWFLVARSSIMKVFDQDSSSPSDFLPLADQRLAEIMSKCELEPNRLEPFFDQISILFNFLTPFINALHLIENESTVISDIIKIYYDVKLAINNNNFFNGINKCCGDKTERQAIDTILNNYLQEHNFSRYYFLAYYLDPRFRDDKRIEENEELAPQVYDALFSYANALGCVSNEEEDREKLVDSLEEFRNGDKLYGMQLLKCPKSPGKFWKHLLRFPGSAKLAYCASRLLSISTRSMLVGTPDDDPSTCWLYEKILTAQQQNANDSGNELLDSDAAEKILPIKSYLVASRQKPLTALMVASNNLDEEFIGSPADVCHNNGTITNISTIISNVITSLGQYAMFIAQPFSSNDLVSPPTTITAAGFGPTTMEPTPPPSQPSTEQQNQPSSLASSSDEDDAEDDDDHPNQIDSQPPQPIMMPTMMETAIDTV